MNSPKVTCKYGDDTRAQLCNCLERRSNSLVVPFHPIVMILDRSEPTCDGEKMLQVASSAMRLIAATRLTIDTDRDQTPPDDAFE